MLKYDGTLFQMTEKFDVIFGTMRNNKVRWMRDCSVVVDCVYVALSDGGIVPNDRIVQGQDSLSDGVVDVGKDSLGVQEIMVGAEQKCICDSIEDDQSRECPIYMDRDCQLQPEHGFQQ